MEGVGGAMGCGRGLGWKGWGLKRRWAGCEVEGAGPR